MNRLRQTFTQHVPLESDPFDDPLNQSWDAVVGHATAASPAAVADDTAFLRHVHALEAMALPSPDFFGALEQRLRDMYPSPASTPDRDLQGAIPRSSLPQTTPKRPLVLPSARPLSFVPAALAMVALLLATSLGLWYFVSPKSAEPTAIPAAAIVEPTMETMVAFDVTPSTLGMPDASTWTHMYFNLIQIEPGGSFSTETDWYVSIEGPLLIVVLSGELTMRPSGPASVYPAGGRDKTPTDIAPGEAVALRPDEAIVYSAVDPATGSNLGSEPVVALQLSIGQLAFSGPGTESGPIDVATLDRQMDWEMDAPATEGASIAIQRLELAPFDSFVFEPDPDSTYLAVFDPFGVEGVRLAEGDVDALTPNVDSERLFASTQLTYPGSGPHTVLNLGAQTATFYFVTLDPLPDSV
jgi:hypothetical protein